MGKRKVKSYSLEFKHSSAKLAVESEQPISKTASELGVHAVTLYGWVKRYGPDISEITNDTLVELKSLRKEVVRLKQERDILKKAAAYFGKRNAVKYAWIKQNKSEFNVALMCDLLGVGRSSYYDWLKDTPSSRTQENQKLAALIKAVFIENRCNYGTRRIRKALILQEITISRRRVGKGVLSH